MDASYEDRQKFSHVIELLSFEPSDVCAPGSITSGIIQQVRIYKGCIPMIDDVT